MPPAATLTVASFATVVFAVTTGFFAEPWYNLAPAGHLRVAEIKDTPSQPLSSGQICTGNSDECRRTRIW